MKNNCLPTLFIVKHNWKMKHSITEEQLLHLIESKIRKHLSEDKLAELKNALNEEETDEGFFNNLKTGAKTFFSNKSKGQGLNTRFKRAKQNFGNQKELDNTQELLANIKKYIQQYNQRQDELDAKLPPKQRGKYKITNDMKVGELIGGKITKGRGKNATTQNKMGKLTGSALSKKKEINKYME